MDGLCWLLFWFGLECLFDCAVAISGLLLCYTDRVC